MSWKFPRIEVEPVIRNLDLISIHNLLLEDSISVSQSVSPSRVVQRGKRVQETSSKTTETTISKCSVVFLLNDVLNAETKVIETLYLEISKLALES
jgi:hypothetical protein